MLCVRVFCCGELCGCGIKQVDGMDILGVGLFWGDEF